MLDTNVLISMAFFPSRNMFCLAECLTRKHTIVLSSFVVDELAEVATRKFPSRKAAIDQLLAGLSYELVYTPHHLKAGLFEIRDVKDYPVLYTAIQEDVDVLLTGDKDFADVQVEKPEILIPTDFLSKYA